MQKFKIGAKSPDVFNVVVEIPMNSDPVKYEICTEENILYVDRFLPVAMRYPANYGFIPQTKAEDGDALDALVLTRFPIVANSVILSRAIGVLIMEDEKGMDEKIIAVPDDKIDPFYAKIRDIKDLDEMTLKQISHFFEKYKDLDKGKWVKVMDYKNAQEAKNLILKFTLK